MVTLVKRFFIVIGIFIAYCLGFFSGSAYAQFETGAAVYKRVAHSYSVGGSTGFLFIPADGDIVGYSGMFFGVSGRFSPFPTQKLNKKKVKKYAFNNLKKRSLFYDDFTLTGELNAGRLGGQYTKNKRADLRITMLEAYITADYDFLRFWAKESVNQHKLFVFAGLGAQTIWHTLIWQKEKHSLPSRDIGFILPYELYSRLALIIPFGVGYRVEINDALHFNSRIGGRFTTSDYLIADSDQIKRLYYCISLGISYSP